MTRPPVQPRLAAALPVLLAALAPGTAAAATFSPTVFTDDATVNGNCTLREAVEAADTDAPVDACPAGDPPPTVDRIELASGTYTLSLGTHLAVSSDLEIAGVHRTQTFLDGNLTSRVLLIEQGVAAEVSAVGIHRGRLTNDFGACVYNLGTLQLTAAEVFDCVTNSLGGGIANGFDSHLTLDDVIVRRNRATSGGGVVSFTSPASTVTIRDSAIRFNDATSMVSGRGGGVLNFAGTLTIERTAIHDNTAVTAGGGVRSNGGTVTLTEVWIHHNATGGSGGGLHVSSAAEVTVSASAITGNQAGARGGGVTCSAADLRLENVTLSGNAAGVEGGGLYNQSSGLAELVHVTLAENTAAGGDAVANGPPGASSVSFANTLIEGDCQLSGGAPFASLGGNLESPGDTCGLGAGDQTGVADPLLSPLGLHGGPTPNHLPLPGGPAIDAALAGECLAVDQRGNLRPIDGDGAGGADCDTGAVEVLLGEDDVTIFTDGFESGDSSAWSATVS